MVPQSLDTEDWAAKVQLDLLRKASSLRRLEIAGEMTAAAWNACRAEFDRLYPHETQDQRDYRFLRHIYGEAIARDFIAQRKRILGPRNETVASTNGKEINSGLNPTA
ncbi:MAG: hypothetical protein HY291_17015 [Planctomycetes bacterium]|nr:hypothetical protein [Planctomycetota bacterium]